MVRKNLEDRKYCSRKCYYSDNKRVVVEVDCSYCKKQIQKSPKELKNSKSGLYFCNIKCKSNAQKIGGIREIMPQHYGTTLYIDYRSLFSPEELICIRCGYDEFESCVHIHHIDENRSNNNKENLIPLCANCHYGLHRGCWSIGDLGV